MDILQNIDGMALILITTLVSILIGAFFHERKPRIYTKSDFTICDETYEFKSWKAA